MDRRGGRADAENGGARRNSGKALGMMQSHTPLAKPSLPCVLRLVLPNSAGARFSLPRRVRPALLGVLYSIQRSIRVKSVITRRFQRKGRRSVACSPARFCARLACNHHEYVRPFRYGAYYHRIPRVIISSASAGGRGLSLVKTTTVFWCCAREHLLDRRFRLLRRPSGSEALYFA